MPKKFLGNHSISEYPSRTLTTKSSYLQEHPVNVPSLVSQRSLMSGQISRDLPGMSKLWNWSAIAKDLTGYVSLNCVNYLFSDGFGFNNNNDTRVQSPEVCRIQMVLEVIWPWVLHLLTQQVAVNDYGKSATGFSVKDLGARLFGKVVPRACWTSCWSAVSF